MSNLKYGRYHNSTMFSVYGSENLSPASYDPMERVVRKMWQEGRSTQDIAVALKCSQTKIAKIRHRLRLPDHKVKEKNNQPEKGPDMEPKITRPKWYEEARKMRGEGVALMDIAKKFDVSPSRVSQVTNSRWEETIARQSMTKQRADEMSDRTFEKFHSKNPEETRNGVLIRCHSCDKTDLFMRPGAINPILVGKAFRQRGWAVGGGPKADTCPECLKKLHPRAKVIEDNKPVSIMNPTSPAAAALFTAPPAVVDVAAIKKALSPPALVKSTDTLTPMTKADKRIIISKIEAVYVDEVTGYSGDWTDEKVATDLGVPIQWVEEVRDDNFGPNINPLLLKAAMTAEQIKKVKEIADLVAKARAEVDAALDKAATATENFDKVIELFELAYKKLNEDHGLPRAKAAA